MVGGVECRHNAPLQMVAIGIDRGIALMQCSCQRQRIHLRAPLKASNIKGFELVLLASSPGLGRTGRDRRSLGRHRDLQTSTSPSGNRYAVD